MPISSRAALAIGLGVCMMVIVAGRTQGQGEAAPKAGTQQAGTPPPPPPARIGSIDMEKIFKDYKKVKFTSEQLKSDAMAKQGELSRVMGQMKQIAQELEGLAPGSNDFKTKEGEITELKVRLESEREKAQADFARREAEALATIYKEVQEMTAAVAKSREMNYVVKVSTEPVTGNEPNSVMAAMARSIVYFDPSMDITSVVVFNLNYRYDQRGGAKPAGTAAGTADPATKPASGTAAPRTNVVPPTNGATAAPRPAAPAAPRTK